MSDIEIPNHTNLLNLPDLSAREKQVLSVLVEYMDRVVSKEEIANALANENAEVGLSSVEIYVHRLRKVVTPHGYAIRSLRGLGYLMEAATS